MHCQQLRILALIVGALMIHQIAAASFYCDQVNGVYKCGIIVTDNEEFVYDTSQPPPQCTGDGLYCAEGMSTFKDYWVVSISNQGNRCFAYCAPIQQYCDHSGCKPYCSADAC